MRVPLLRREAAAYIKLRRQGYAISTIAKAFGRSISVIYHRIRKAQEYGILLGQDLRKIPNRTRRISKALQWNRMMFWMPLWEAWILGEGDRPP
jgi:transposase